jgi:hypothetical protein
MRILVDGRGKVGNLAILSFIFPIAGMCLKKRSTLFLLFVVLLVLYADVDCRMIGNCVDVFNYYWDQRGTVEGVGMVRPAPHLIGMPHNSAQHNAHPAPQHDTAPSHGTVEVHKESGPDAVPEDVDRGCWRWIFVINW